MYNFPRDKKGIALFMVLGTILIVVVLANVMLAMISSHGRLTHHQVSRIQAYYAAQAGVNYAYESLRVGAWDSSDCPAPNGCLLSALDPNFAADFPHTVSDVRIILKTPSAGSSTCPNTLSAGTVCINATATYTYTP